MSRCTDCNKEMHPADAAQSLVCRLCKTKYKDYKPYSVRSINGPSAEAVGRRTRNPKALEGRADMGNDGDMDTEE